LKLETMLKEPLADLTKEEFFDYLKELYRKGEKSTIYTLIQTADKLFPQEYSTIFDALPFDAKSLKANYEGFFKSNATFVEQVMLADFNVKMPDDFLLVDDATSMAHSLESRVPFLDNELVEFAFSIPHHMKVANNQGKYILKKALEPHLHINTLKKKKQGFGPDTFHIYQTEIQEVAKQRLLEGNLVKNRLVNKDFVQRLICSDPNPA
jgi:asparagine synthetase B (glutamine-hydrolysing)